MCNCLTMAECRTQAHSAASNPSLIRPLELAVEKHESIGVASNVSVHLGCACLARGQAITGPMLD